MGLFSSSYVISIETATMRVIEDEMVNDSLQTAVINGIFNGQGVTRSIINSYTKSPQYKTERMFRHIKDNYPKGLMASTVTSNRAYMNVIKQEIAKVVGLTDITLLYAKMNRMNLNHLTYERLVADYGYNPATNELGALTAAQGFTVYMDDFFVAVPEAIYTEEDKAGHTWAFDSGPSSGYTPERTAEPLNIYTVAPETVIIGNTSTPRAYVQWVGIKATEDAEGKVTEEIVRGGYTFDLDMPEDGTEHFQVKYKSGDTVSYISYEYGSGGNAILDGLYDIPNEAPASYMPVVYFRRNHMNLSDKSNEGTAEYEAASKAVDYLGMDYQAMGENIHENPDIDSVRNVYLMFGASPTSSDQAMREYMFAFFSKLLFGAQSLDIEEDGLFRTTSISYLGQRPDYSVSIRMAPKHHQGEHQLGANLTMNMVSLSSRTHAGKLGPVGSYHTEIGSHNFAFNYQARVYNPGEDYGTYETKTKHGSYPVLFIRYQATTSTYQEIRVDHPSIRYHIDDKRSTFNDLNDEDFMIPIDNAIIENWPRKDMDSLYQRSLHMVFNVRDKQEVKWYESGFFKFVITAAAIAIAIYFQQPHLAIAAATAGITTAMVWSFVLAVVETLVYKYAFELIADELGSEFALLAAVVAAVYGSYQIFQNGGSLQGAPWAAELLTASAGLSNAARDRYQEDILDIESDYEDLLELEEQREEKLNEARELLTGNGHSLNPLNFVMDETPEEFYYRTVHSGNIGTLGYEAIHSFVDIRLTLPGR